MATLEELIRRRLVEDEALSKLLARYGDTPAVFHQSAPDDTAREWGQGKRQYPRIEFDVDLQANPERQTSGELAVHVVCEATGRAPEEVVPLIRAALSDVFLRPIHHSAMSLAWARTESFEMHQRADARMLLGASVFFDLYEFPTQITSDPDPVAAIHAYAKQFDRAVVVVGEEEMPDFFRPTRERSAVYFRVVESEIDEQTNTVVWMRAVLAAHFFAPDISDRATWIRAFTDRLALDGEVTMLDRSPMFVLNIRGDAARDEQSGQLRISVRYGLLRRPQYAHTLTMMPAREGGK